MTANDINAFIAFERSADLILRLGSLCTGMPVPKAIVKKKKPSTRSVSGCPASLFLGEQNRLLGLFLSPPIAFSVSL